MTFTVGDLGVFETNITHNLNKMAEAAGIYEALWHPERLPSARAGDLIEPLTKGLMLLKLSPEYYSTFDALNGWGVYDDFVPFVEEYIKACREFPHATVEASV